MKKIKVILIALLIVLLSLAFFACDVGEAGQQGNQGQQGEQGQQGKPCSPGQSVSTDKFIRLGLVENALIMPFLSAESQAFRVGTDFFVSIRRFANVDGFLVGAGFDIEWEMSHAGVIEQLPRDYSDAYERKFYPLAEFRTLQEGIVILTARSTVNRNIFETITIEVVAPTSQTIAVQQPWTNSAANASWFLVPIIINDVYLVNEQEFLFVNTIAEFDFSYQSTVFSPTTGSRFVSDFTWWRDTVGFINGEIYIRFWLIDNPNVSAGISFRVQNRGFFDVVYHV